MEKSHNIRAQYEALLPDYHRLRTSVESAINHFLQKEEIGALAVTSRIKSIESFVEKVTRKEYENPILDNEDFVGIRIITYFPDEVVKICDLVDREFNVEKTDDKFEQLGDDQFGYRSVHKIIAIPNDWFCAPNYRGLEGLKVELQVRTILMHAWAEVEHKLQYKNAASVPRKFRRKLFQLSAKFEEADEQFQSLRDGIMRYDAEVAEVIKDDDDELSGVEIDSNTLREYLKEKYGKERHTSNKGYSELANELAQMSIESIGVLDKILDATRKGFLKYERERPPYGKGQFADVGVVRISLAIISQKYREIKELSLSSEDMEPFYDLVEDLEPFIKSYL